MTTEFATKIRAAIERYQVVKMSSRVTAVTGLLIESTLVAGAIGDSCIVYGKGGKEHLCEIVGFKEGKSLLLALGDCRGIAPGSEVLPLESEISANVGMSLIGRVVGALGEPLDGKGSIFSEVQYPLKMAPEPAMQKKAITEIFPTGVKSIDGLVTVGVGQRMGIFAGSGIGKSTLLGMLADKSAADVNVIALIGERGREVRAFLEENLGPLGRHKSVVVVSTSDESAPRRCKGAYYAIAIAEYFRDRGKKVLFLMDSLSRFLSAEREIAMAAGEPMTLRGYPASVFDHLPRFLERAGRSDRGSITAFYTLLAEGDDMLNPLIDHARSLLDGHIVLSRKLAVRRQYPAVDVVESLSRLMEKIADRKLIKMSDHIRRLLQVHGEAEELIQLGAYSPGSDATLDEAIAKKEQLKNFLSQLPQEAFSMQEINSLMAELT